MPAPKHKFRVVTIRREKGELVSEVVRTHTTLKAAEKTKRALPTPHIQQWSGGGWQRPDQCQ